jgi:hypothetical protein
MFRRIAMLVALTAGLVFLSETPALASTMNVTVTATCMCKYTVAVSGHTTPNALVTVTYSFTVTSHGVDYIVNDQVFTTADADGNFSETIPGIGLPGSCDDTVEFSGGSASLTLGEDAEKGFAIGLPSTLFCLTEPPPPGKTLDIGPSSMEGRLLMRPGDWISGGYSFVFVSGGHAATTVTVTSKMTLPYRCADGTTGEFIINLGTHDYDVPAGNKTWQPTGDANSVLSWAGSGLAPAGCGPGNIMENSRGAIFEATVLQNPDTGSLLNWRFKYRDPNAKGKGNVNCLDTTDPRRNKADVCGASWSGTLRDP